MGLKGENLVSLIRRYPLITFFVLACALSWWPWILYSFDLVPTPIVGFGPFLAALVVLALTRGKTGVVGLLRRMVLWRVGLQWYAAALGLPIGVTLTAAAINVFVLGAQPSSSAAELGGWSSLIPTFFILLLIPGRLSMGGAGLQRVRPAALANRSLSPLCWPNPGGAVVLLAPTVLYYRV